MKNKFLLLAVAFFATTSVAFAQTSAVTSSDLTAKVPELKATADVKASTTVKTNKTTVGADASTTVKVKGASNGNVKASTTATSTLKGKLVEKKLLLKKKLNDFAKRHIETIVGKVQKKFAASSDRMIKIDAKIETRINKFADMGVDVADAKALLVKARADLLAAQTKLGELAAKIKAELAKEETSRDAINASVTEVKEGFKTAHASYVKVIASLKAKGGVDGNGTGTTTASTSAKAKLKTNVKVGTTTATTTSATSTNN